MDNLVGIDTRGLHEGDYFFEFTFRCDICDEEWAGEREHWLFCPLCGGSLRTTKQTLALSDAGHLRLHSNTEAARRLRRARGEREELPHYYQLHESGDYAELVTVNEEKAA